MNKMTRWLLSPVILWLCFFLFVPFIAVIVVSFLARNPYGGVVFTWDPSNYARIFDSLYMGIYGETLLISLVTTVICLLVSYPLAWYIAQLDPLRQKIWLILVTMPFWINFLIRTYAWIVLLRSQGVVNSLLLEWGWIDEPLQMLYTRGAVLVGMVYTLIPFMILSLYVSIERLDKKLLEAAYDLGARKWSAFWHITLPETKSGILSGSVLVFVSTMGMFIVTDVLGGAKSLLISNIIQNQFLGARDWPFGAALSVFFVVTSLLLIALMQWALRSGYERRRNA